MHDLTVPARLLKAGGSMFKSCLDECLFSPGDALLLRLEFIDELPMHDAMDICIP